MEPEETRDGNGNDQASNLVRLTNVVNGYNSSPLYPSLPQLPAPILAGATDLGSNGVSAAWLLGYDYAVLHYGSGPGGSPGGGVALYYLNGASQFTFPSQGTGSHGLGGFSSLTLYKGKDPVNSVPVPDGGSTITLLGAVLALVGAAHRKIALTSL